MLLRLYSKRKQISLRMQNSFGKWKMCGYNGSKLKVGIIVFGIMFYVYLLLVLKTLYVKGKKLDHISSLAEDTDKKFMNLQKLDQEFGEKLFRATYR